jgi:hypothetical protein
MHWIDPACVPETQGTVEGFTNRHIGPARDALKRACGSKHKDRMKQKKRGDDRAYAGAGK